MNYGMKAFCLQLRNQFIFMYSIFNNQIFIGADIDIRDYSGKKPLQYERSKSNSESTETIHSKCHEDHSAMAVATTILKRYASFRVPVQVPAATKSLPTRRKARPKTSF